MPKTKRGKTARRRGPGRDVEVLATLLVAYPQISRVTFDPGQRSLGIVFLCRGPKSKKRKAAFSKLYSDSIQVFLDLTGRKAKFIKTSWEKMGDLHCFHVERDVPSISPEELNVTTELVSDCADVVWATDEFEKSEMPSELAFSARLFLQEMLDEVQHLKGPRKLVALREGEKVLVFDK